MKQKSWHLNRRQVIAGGGLALGLPFLESMASTKGSERNLPKRLVVAYFAYGSYMPNGGNGIQNMSKPHDEWSWWPCQKAGELTFNKNQSPFKDMKEYVSYLEGLDHKGGWVMGGHSAGDVFSTGADMTGAETTNNISIDQVAAKYQGHHTRHASMTLGSEGGTGSYGTSKTLSHYGPGRPIPSMSNLERIFDKLFKPYAGKSVEQVRTELKREKSVLDLMLSDSKSLKRRLGRADKAKVDEHLESFRATEKRIQRLMQWTYKPVPNMDKRKPVLKVDFKKPHEYIRSMYDLIFLAFQTDSTRFATFLTESEHSNQNEVWNFAKYALGYNGATHDIGHRRPKDYAGQWDQWRNANHAYFLRRLKETSELDGNMLDNTVVLWGCSHPHASHSNKNYPIQVAGGNKLGFKHGKLHKFIGAKKVPLANLFVSMLNAVDVPVKKFADSTGPMKELRA